MWLEGGVGWGTDPNFPITISYIARNPAKIRCWLLFVLCNFLGYASLCIMQLFVSCNFLVYATFWFMQLLVSCCFSNTPSLAPPRAPGVPLKAQMCGNQKSEMRVFFLEGHTAVIKFKERLFYSLFLFEATLRPYGLPKSLKRGVFPGSLNKSWAFSWSCIK